MDRVRVWRAERLTNSGRYLSHVADPKAALDVREKPQD